MLYDKPVRDLMVAAAEAMPEVFSISDLVAWFSEHYPLVKATTVRAHVTGLTANSSNRHHFPGLASRPPLFYRSGRDRFERYDETCHGADDDALLWDLADDDDVLALAGSSAPYASETQVMQFALEAYLDEFMATNWDLIDWGRPLAIWTGKGEQYGHQFSTPVGRLDFLAIDASTGALVVVELKRGRPNDQVVGQIARYMGWVRAELAEEGQLVEGLIVAAGSDERLRYAVSAVPGVRILLYEVSFSLREP